MSTISISQIQHSFTRVASTGVLLCALMLLHPSVAMAQSMTPVARSVTLVQLESILAQLLTIQRLLDALIAAESATPTTRGDVTSLLATTDFLTGRTTVAIGFTTQEEEQIELPTVYPDDVLAELSTYLGIDEEMVRERIEFVEVNATAPVAVEFRLRSSRDIGIVTTQANGQVIDYRVPQTEIDALIQSGFGGITTIYDAVVDSYAAQLQRGQRPPEVIDFIAEITSIPPATLKPILEIDVSSRYQRNAST